MSAVVVVLAVGIGLAPAGAAILGIAFLLGQASVGLSNDWIDVERDRAVGRMDKPLATGLISVPLVRNTAFTTAAIAIALTLVLGIAATIAHTIFIVSAWSYNVWLKKTLFSVVPYLVSFGLLPLIVSLAATEPRVPSPWAFALGALLGVSAHFANVLPDLDDDERTGIAGLPHRLGKANSGTVIWVALSLAAASAFFGPAGAPSVLQFLGLILTLALAAVIAVMVRRPPTRLLFQLIIAAAMVNVVVLAFSGARLFG